MWLPCAAAANRACRQKGAQHSQWTCEVRADPRVTADALSHAYAECDHDVGARVAMASAQRRASRHVVGLRGDSRFGSDP